MRIFVYLSLLFISSIYSYNRDAVQNYAATYCNTLNHNYGTAYYQSSPYSYWGGEHCGYPSQGGDCANFVSQCILAGGHPSLKGWALQGVPLWKRGNRSYGTRSLPKRNLWMEKRLRISNATTQ